MPPKAKARKPKKPVQQKQKQKQSQRVVVNVNQAKRAPAKRRRQTRQPQQQVVYQPIITSGSVPVPAPFPTQSSGGFTPMTPTPTSLGTPISISAPVVLPTFSEEPVRVIGGEDVSVPTPVSVKVPTPIPVKEPPLSIITEITPSLRPPPPTIASTPIIKPAPPKSIITQPSRGSDKQFLEPTATPTPSVSSLFSDISKETGITSQKVADFLFKKKKQEPKAPPPSIASSSPPSSIASSSAMSVPTSIPTSTTKADYLFLDDRSIPDDRSISSMSGFNPPSEKSSIKKQPIIAEPKETVVLKKPELKRSNPYDIFSDNESMARGGGGKAEDIFSVVTVGARTPPKKRPVMSSESESEVNIIPLDKPAGRRLAPVSESRAVTGSNPYSNLTAGEVTALAKKQGIPTTKKGSKGQDVRIPKKDLIPLLN